MFLEEPSSVTVCAVAGSGNAASFRVAVAPTAANGLDQPSLILADKIVTIRRESVDRMIGSVDNLILVQLDQALRYWLDL